MNKQKMLRLIIGLTLQEIYKDNTNKLKEDFEKARIEGKNLGTDIKLAMEEYANTGFAKIIVADILEKD